MSPQPFLQRLAGTGARRANRRHGPSVADDGHRLASLFDPVENLREPTRRIGRAQLLQVRQILHGIRLSDLPLKEAYDRPVAPLPGQAQKDSAAQAPVITVSG